MPFRARRRLPRAWFLAILVLTAVGPVPALAGGPGSAQARAPEVPEPAAEPREQHRGDVAGFRLPFEPGAEVRVDQGWNTGFSHKGKHAYAYDFGLPIGTKILASAAGVVAYVHEGETACGGAELLKDANVVTIYHPDGSATQYGHLSTIDVKVGDVVAAGQVIGKSGDTGYSQCIPHLHFARQYQGRIVSPSVPVYFEGYAAREFRTGDVVTAPAASCAGPLIETVGTSDSTVGAAGDTVLAGALAAAADLAFEPILGAFCGTYVADTLAVPQSFSRQDASLSFDWRSNGPGGYWLDAADVGFSASWSGRFTFPSAGHYTIGVFASGAVTVAIDGVAVIDRQIDAGQPVELTVSKDLGAGIHRIDVQYTTTNGHGVLKLAWGRLLADG